MGKMVLSAAALAAALAVATGCGGPPHTLTDEAGAGWNCVTTWTMAATYCVRPPGCLQNAPCSHEPTAWCFYEIAPVYGGYNCHALRSACEAGRAEFTRERVSPCEEYR